MQATLLFPVTRCPNSYHQILRPQCNSNKFELVQQSRFQRQHRPHSTTAPIMLLLLRHLSNNSNTPQCSPQGLPSLYFSRCHRATSSPPGYTVCALQSPNTKLCLRLLQCVDLRVVLPRWNLSVLLWHQHHLLPSRWEVVRHRVLPLYLISRGHVPHFRILPLNQR